MTLFSLIFLHCLDFLWEEAEVTMFFIKLQCDFGPKWPFLARLAKIGQNEKFYQKSGRAIFLPLLSPNFMPSFRKIVVAVSEINSLITYEHPNMMYCNTYVKSIMDHSSNKLNKQIYAVLGDLGAGRRKVLHGNGHNF